MAAKRPVSASPALVNSLAKPGAPHPVPALLTRSDGGPQAEEVPPLRQAAGASSSSAANPQEEAQRPPRNIFVVPTGKEIGNTMLQPRHGYLKFADRWAQQGHLALRALCDIESPEHNTSFATAHPKSTNDEWTVWFAAVQKMFDKCKYPWLSMRITQQSIDQKQNRPAPFVEPMTIPTAQMLIDEQPRSGDQMITHHLSG